MKSLQLAICGALIATTAQAASSSPTNPVWEGIGYVTHATSVCVANGDDQVGWSYRVIFKPKDASTNNGSDSIALISGKAVVLLQAGATGYLAGTTTYNGHYIYGRGGTGDYKGVSTINYTPTKIMPATGIINMTLSVGNNWNDKGCTADIEVNLSPRPN